MILVVLNLMILIIINIIILIFANILVFIGSPIFGILGVDIYTFLSELLTSGSRPVWQDLTPDKDYHDHDIEVS